MYCDISRLVQSIKTDIGKPFDKSITIDNSNLNVIDFIDQLIEIDTHSHRCSFKVLLVFSVTPFKIDQNKNQNHSIDKVQNLGN